MPKPKNPPYAKGRAQCIYCGSYENMSREHIWADWLREYVPREMERHSGITITVESDISKSTAKKDKREGDFHARKLRIACRPCNSGWMSQLQEKAKPHLIPMLTGSSASFYRAEQTILAAWITMFVMTAEHLDTDGGVITQKERTWLKNRQRPPANWRIWIGKYEQPATTKRWMHAKLNVVEDKPEFIARGIPEVSYAQASTILLGNQLIIHVMSSPVMTKTVRRWQILPAADPAMQQIWPVIRRRVDWPKTIAIRGRVIEDMAFHFFKRADTIARRLGD